MLTLFPWLPGFHICQLAEELAGSIERQILNFLITKIVAMVLKLAWIYDLMTPGVSINVINGHTVFDKIAVVLTEISTCCMSIWMLKHAIIIAFVNVRTVRLRCHFIWLPLLFWPLWSLLVSLMMSWIIHLMHIDVLVVMAVTMPTLEILKFTRSEMTWRIG